MPHTQTKDCLYISISLFYEPPTMLPDMTDVRSGVSWKRVLGVALLLFAGFTCMAVFSYAPSQVQASSPRTHNLCGNAGAWLAHGLISTSGIGVAALLLSFVGAGIALSRNRFSHAYRRLSGVLLVCLTTPALTHLIPAMDWSLHLQAHWQHIELQGLGGLIGSLLTGPASEEHNGGVLIGFLGIPGSALVLVGLWMLSFVLMDIGIAHYYQRINKAVKQYTNTRAHKRVEANRLPPRSQRDSTHQPPPETQHEHTPSNFKPVINQPEAQAEETASKKIPETSRVSKLETDEVQRKMRNRATTSDGDASALIERIKHRRQQFADEAEAGEEELHADEEKDSSGSGLSNSDIINSRESEHDISPVEEQHEPQTLTEDTNTELPETPPLVEKSIEPTIEEPAPPKKKEKAAPKKTAKKNGDYDLPAAGLLDAAPDKRLAESAAETARTSVLIEQIFENFKVNVKVVQANRGPYITQYELELQDAGMRLNKVESLEKEMSLNLGTEGIRIVAPLPNKTTIGIEVPNQLKEAVVMRDLVEEMSPDKYALPLIIGRDVLGDALVGDLAKMPHLLVAGATGMGKSVCLNAIICSVLLFRDPKDVKFILVDPKMVELAPYEDIPHLLAPPITDMTKAHAALEWACKTMDERYHALRLAGVRDISSFNKLGETTLRERLAKKGKTMDDLYGVNEHMPYIVIVVDEYADLMMVNKEVEKSIVRLTAKSRACGIHIILTTQRPSADVVTGLIKSNLPSRISFRVADRNNSRVVLDCAGAENLLGKGDMLYLPPGTSSPVRGQGVWVKDHEIDAIIDHAREQGDPDYDDAIFTIGASAMQGGGNSGSDSASGWVSERQFHQAVYEMFRANRSGADFLRRRLGVGYNKATSFVEWMEDLGFLSEAKGTRPREFLKSWQDWIDLLKENDVSWEEEDEIYTDPFA